MSRSALRAQLDEVKAEHGCSMAHLTVLADKNDPYRLDTPARHRDAQWLATTTQELGLGDRKIHLRGLHYMLIGRPKPDGTPYTNTDADWTWLQADAAKAARWLGYIPFDQIVDQRNTPPTVTVFEWPEPSAYVTTGLSIEIPDAEDLKPEIGVRDFDGAQPYKLVFVGEKSSLEPVLAPIAQARQADLYLPTGEMSDTLIHQMAQTGAADGRPMVVLYFSDCDPAGWQMPVSVSRKLQGFKTQLFPDLEFQVHRVALTPEQVKEYGLPSTPLKDTERRADKWMAAKKVSQTEIDSLASLRPELLRKIARDACAPFFDLTLEGRVRQARAEWLSEAQRVVDDRLGQEGMETFREQAAERLADMAEELEMLKDALRVDVTYDDLPDFIIPEPEINMPPSAPLLDSSWSFVDQCRALKGAKSYDEGDPS